jgi:hypothetical protein
MSENENNTPTPLRGGKLNSSHEVILNQTIYQLKIILV